jgi:hypothetical protein
VESFGFSTFDEMTELLTTAGDPVALADPAEAVLVNYALGSCSGPAPPVSSYLSYTRVCKPISRAFSNHFDRRSFRFFERSRTFDQTFAKLSAALSLSNVDIDTANRFENHSAVRSSPFVFRKPFSKI